MTIRFSCSAGHKLSVPDDLAGRKVRCPTCNAKVNVPGQSTPQDGNPQQPPVAAPPVAAPPIAAATNAAPIAAPAGKPEVPQLPQTAAVPPASKTKAKPPQQKAVSKPPSPAPTKSNAPTKDTAPTKSGAPSKPQPKSPKPGKAQTAGKPAAKAKQDAKKSGKSSKSEQAKPAPSNAASPSAPAASAPATLSLPFPEAGTELPVSAGGRPKTSGFGVRTESNEYKAESGRVQTTYLLAVGVGGVAVLAALPAFPHINLLEAPVWAIAVLVGFLLHALYVMWLVSLPDWSTAWMGGCVLSVTSLLYVAGAGMAAMSAGWLGLAGMRGTAVSWSIVMCVLFGLMAFACFRFGAGWRREFDAMTPSEL